MFVKELVDERSEDVVLASMVSKVQEVSIQVQLLPACEKDLVLI